MPKPICITQKKLPKVCVNIDPENLKAKSLDMDSINGAKVSYSGRRFRNSIKDRIVSSQHLEPSKSIFWGSAVDIDI